MFNKKEKKAEGTYIVIVAHVETLIGATMRSSLTKIKYTKVKRRSYTAASSWDVVLPAYIYIYRERAQKETLSD